jgi:hypothetical protein
MARDQWECDAGQLTFYDVQIGPAHPAHMNFHQHLIRFRFRDRALAQLEPVV